MPDWLSQSLRAGERLPYDLCDDNGALLLSAGSALSQRALRKLRSHYARGVNWKQPAPAEQSLPQTPGPTPRRPTRPDPHAPPRLELPELRRELRAGLTSYRQMENSYLTLALNMPKTRSIDLVEVRDLLGGINDLITKDRSLGPLLLDLKSDPNEYLFKHGVNAAILSMTLASQMGFGCDQVIEAGIAALVQDLGMLRVPWSIRLATRPLTQAEWFQIKQHPIHTFDLLERLSSVPPSIRWIAQQAHERCDGSGYPRGRCGMFIHPLARVLAVVDTYVAATSQRPHRQPMSPYRGVVTLLHEARQGRLDRDVVRGFLDCMSLYPIGSYVCLSDGTLSKVLRSNHSLHTQPVVLPMNADGSESDRELDLAKSPSIHVAGVLE